MNLKRSLVYSGSMPKLLCCDTILRKMPNGDWVAFFLSGGPIEPHPENRAYCMRSTDEGASWGRLRQLFPGAGAPALVITEVSVIGDRVIAFMTAHEGGFINWKTYYAESFDSAHTWGEIRPVPHVSDHSFIRTLHRLKNGDLILPYQHVEISKEECETLLGEGKKIFQGVNAEFENGVLISSDGGKSWSAHGGVKLSDKALTSSFIWMENDIAQLSDGTLSMLCRVCRTGRLYRSDSKDGGRTWGPTYATDIPNAASKIRLFNLDGGRIALLHNPAEYRPGLFCRNPISLWISDDDMKTWKVKRDIENFPGALSYPDGFVEEGWLHFVYDYSRHDVIYTGIKL